MNPIRRATAADAAAVHAIYAPIVRDTPISFEVEPPSLEEVRRRIEAAREGPAWLALDEGGELAGFAYASPFRERAAYRWTVSASIYVREGARGRGAGRALVEALLATLRLQGYRSVVGTVTLPNAACLWLLATCGFREAGLLPRAGWKLGRWWDVALWRRELAGGEAPPGEPLPASAVTGTAAWRAAMESLQRDL